MCMQYFWKWQRSTIRGLIENAILEADAKGIKVLSLGLLNQVIVTLCLKPQNVPTLAGKIVNKF